MRRSIRRSTSLFYVLVTLFCVGGCIVILQYGTGLQTAEAPRAVTSDTPATAALLANFRHPLSILLLQLIVVVSAGKLLGWLFQRIRQPTVIGEMVAGIVLGPSLLGMALPEVEGFLFPATSLGSLQLLSHLGVILFMFFIGLELDLSAVRQRARAAVLVSHVGIVAPFVLGCAFALGVYSTLAPDGVAFAPFALFMGIAMSITAFPVLARIMQERGLTHTPLGAVALTCAAVEDVTAWCLLAVVVALSNANGLAGSALTIALAVLFVTVMFRVVRPRVVAFAARGIEHGASHHGLIVAVLLFACTLALCTEAIGIHALFGAFIAGAIIPSNAPISRLLRERVESFSGAFLLPLFFAFTGLRTQIGLLDSPEDWLLCAGIIAVAIAGKFGGACIAARIAGMGWRDAAVLGALMNTRGLMELIVLNIGYDLGILSPRVFAMMVVMALVTTLMTGPLLSLLEKRQGRVVEAASN